MGLEAKLNEMADKILVDLDHIATEWNDYGLPIYDDDMEKRLKDVAVKHLKTLLDLPEVKGLVEAHEKNAHQSNCEFCCASDRSRAAFAAFNEFCKKEGEG